MDKKELNEVKQRFIHGLIYKNYYNKKIDDNLVYVESMKGNDFTGSVLRIVEELSSGKYGSFKINVYAKPEVHDKIKLLQKNYSLKIDKIISKESKATMTLEKAKYIITDYALPSKYVKKEGQIMINAWHETPLKLMGKDNVNEEHLLGNLQYPLLCSDYFIFSNDFTKETLTNAYMIEKIFPGKALMEGSPKNSVFLDGNRKEELKSKLGFDNHEIFAYVPEFMDKGIEDILVQIDEKLNDDQMLLVKLPFGIDFSKFSNIKAFPAGYEPYDVVNMADALVTDYSTSLFDFANAKRKIILFNYNMENLSQREFYLSFSDMPFPKVDNVDDLILQLNTPKGYDDNEFVELFCQYDSVDCVKNICRHIFNNEKCCREVTIKNDKENILIYAGSLWNNGITSSLKNMLENVDLDRYNYFLSYRQWDANILENHERIFRQLPENVEFLPFSSRIRPTLKEHSRREKLFNSEKFTWPDKTLYKLFKRSFDKQYFPLDFKIILNYDGYNKNESLMFAYSGVKNAIWVHNDMLQEIRTRGNQNINILKEAYSKSDNVCVVSKDLIKPTSEISGRSDNIRIIHNIINFEEIINDSEREILFDEDTEYFSTDSIEKILLKPGMKFITIGRFSPEKGHKRLIKTFNEFCRDYPDSQLIIIGGHGPLYDETVDLIKNTEYGKNISIIKSISNPMPILKQCDLFILPSFYEGWGIVIMEADTLGVPVIATDVVGTQWLRDYGGYLVENSDEGILNGMHDFVDGKIHTLDIDYEEFNNEIINDLYSLIED